MHGGRGGVDVCPASRHSQVLGVSRTSPQKGCWLLLQEPAASWGGPAWGDTWLLNQLPLPGSSLRSGGGPCATVSKPGARALWMLLQAGKLLLVPAMPLPEGWEPWLEQATLSSPVTQRPVSSHAAGSHSIAFPW